MRPRTKQIHDREEYAATPADCATPTPEEYVQALEEEGEPPQEVSLTLAAAEALEEGLYPPQGMEEIPGQDQVLAGGDADASPLRNAYVGEEFPGSSTPTPDQGNVDDVGRIYGISQENAVEIHGIEELMERRDVKRWEAEALSTDQVTSSRRS